MFLRNITIFLENIKVFFAAWECVKTKPRPYEPKDSIVHVLTHPPVCKVCTYASGYTYGGIRPHVYTYRTTRIELHVRTHEPARIYVIVSGWLSCNSWGINIC